jgi:hypothetical protein
MNFVKDVFTGENANLIIKKSDINGNLWLGNMKAALDLDFLVDNNISVILNISPDIPYIFDIMDPEMLCKQNKNYCGLRQLDTMRIPVFDSLLPHDIYLMEQYLPEVLPYIIQKLYKERKNVLIHCFAGAQRSAVIVAALLYTVQEKGHLPEQKSKCMNDVINYIIKKRPRVFSWGIRVNFRESIENYFNIKL